MRKSRLHKWYFIFAIRRDLDWFGKRVFELGVFKIHTLPVEGCTLEKKHYKGFKIYKRFDILNFNINNIR